MNHLRPSVVGANQRREVAHGAKVGLNRATLALHSGILDLQVGEGLRLYHELVGKVVALSMSSSAARSFARGAAPASAAWSGYGGRPVARVTRSASLFMTQS